MGLTGGGIAIIVIVVLILFTMFGILIWRYVIEKKMPAIENKLSTLKELLKKDEDETLALAP